MVFAFRDSFENLLDASPGKDIMRAQNCLNTRKKFLSGLRGDRPSSGDENNVDRGLCSQTGLCLKLLPGALFEE